MYKFSKERMLKRLERENRLNRVDEEVTVMMDNLDGQKATTSCFARLMMGEPVMWVVGKDGTGQYVCEDDCI